MDIPQETDDYLRESIEFSLGLPVSTSTLELKLRASEESQRRIRDQYLYLISRLKEKDEIIERVRVCNFLLISLTSTSFSLPYLGFVRYCCDGDADLVKKCVEGN